MLAKKRREEIKEIIIKKKTVKVSELCKLFQVSGETIRRDLKFLEKTRAGRKILWRQYLKGKYFYFTNF